MKSLKHILSKSSNFHSLNDILGEASNYHFLNDILGEASNYHSLNDIAQESLRITLDDKPYEYFPETFEELQSLLCERSKELKPGDIFDLTDIDVSGVDKISYADKHSPTGNLYYTIFGKIVCSKMYIIDVTGWDVSKFDCLAALFSSFDDLIEVRGLETWDISNATDISCLFRECKRLNTANIDDWNVSRISKATNTFEHCYVLDIDLSKWNLSEYCNTNEMFKKCNPKIIPNWHKK